METKQVIKVLVRRHSSKFQANCALFDISMKSGTLIVVIKTSIFRYSAKLKFQPSPWKPRFISIHGIPLFSQIFANAFISVYLVVYDVSCLYNISHLH